MSARSGLALILAVLLAAILAGCSVAVPVAAAASYVGGQTIGAHMPDSIANTKARKP